MQKAQEQTRTLAGDGLSGEVLLKDLHHLVLVCPMCF